MDQKQERDYFNELLGEVTELLDRSINLSGLTRDRISDLIGEIPRNGEVEKAQTSGISTFYQLMHDKLNYIRKNIELATEDVRRLNFKCANAVVPGIPGKRV